MIYGSDRVRLRRRHVEKRECGSYEWVYFTYVGRLGWPPLSGLALKLLL
jgi:hypothetical protein